MKKLLVALLLILTIPATAGVMTNYYTFTDFNLNPLAVVRVTQTPIQPFADYNGAILAPIPISFASSGAGTVYFTNTIAGYAYRVQIDAPPGSPTIRTCGYPSSLSGFINGRDWLGNFGPGSVGGIPGLVFYYLNIAATNLLNSGSTPGQVLTATAGGIAWSNSTGGGGGGGITTNWFNNTNVTLYSLTISTNPVDGSFAQLAGGIWQVSSNVFVASLTTTNGITNQTLTASRVMISGASKQEASLAAGLADGWFVGETSSIPLFTINGGALTNVSNATATNLAPGATINTTVGSALWNVFASWLNLTNVPLQLYQLGTNYMAGITNAGGDFVTNSIQGIIEAGATTNSHHVVTLPGIISTNWTYNTNVAIAGQGTYALQLYDGLSVSNATTGAWTYITNGCMTMTNPTAANQPSIIECNGIITVYNGPATSQFSNILATGWGQINGGFTNGGPAIFTNSLTILFGGQFNGLGGPGITNSQGQAMDSLTATNDQRALTLGGVVRISTLSVTNNITNSVLTANQLVGTDGNKALTTVTVGSGLTLSGGTLTSSGGGGTGIQTNGGSGEFNTLTNLLVLGNTNGANALIVSNAQTTATADVVDIFGTNASFVKINAGAVLTDSSNIVVGFNGAKFIGLSGLTNANGAALGDIWTEQTGAAILTNLTVNDPVTNFRTAVLTLDNNLIVSNTAASAVPALVVTNWANQSAQFDGNTNINFEVELKNWNSGSNANGGFLVEADNGNSAANFVTFGINSSGFTNPPGTLGQTNDAWFFMQSGTNSWNLWIGNLWTNRNSSFSTGGIQFAIGTSNNIPFSIVSNGFNDFGSSNHLEVATGGSWGVTNFNVTTQFVQNQFVQGINMSNATSYLNIAGGGIIYSNGTFGNIVPSDWLNTNGFYNYTNVDLGASNAQGGWTSQAGRLSDISIYHSTNTMDNVWTPKVDASLHVQLMTMFTSNLTINGIENLNANLEQETITFITNRDSSSHQVVFPTGTAIFQALGTNISFPVASITCTNGKRMRLDWLFYSHLGQETTNVNVWIQTN